MAKSNIEGRFAKRPFKLKGLPGGRKERYTYDNARPYSVSNGLRAVRYPYEPVCPSWRTSGPWPKTVVPALSIALAEPLKKTTPAGPGALESLRLRHE